jgi:uncharacterized LabA/DUF88 family protein
MPMSKKCLKKLQNMAHQLSNEFMLIGPNQLFQAGKSVARKCDNSCSTIQLYFWKNSSDSALIIDAMDILYTGNVDGFCITSATDFTRLATRLREAGMKVIGIGEKKNLNTIHHRLR